MLKKEVPTKEFLQKEVSKPIVTPTPKQLPIVHEEIDPSAEMQTPLKAPKPKTTLDPKAKEAFLYALREMLSEQKSYPRSAKRRSQQGVCTIGFTLNKDGKISQRHIVKSSGYSTLDKATLELIKGIDYYINPSQKMSL